MGFKGFKPKRGFIGNDDVSKASVAALHGWQAWKEEVTERERESCVVWCIL